jgi:hypothetical protein
MQPNLQTHQKPAGVLGNAVILGWPVAYVVAGAGFETSDLWVHMRPKEIGSLSFWVEFGLSFLQVSDSQGRSNLLNWVMRDASNIVSAS